MQPSTYTLRLIPHREPTNDRYYEKNNWKSGYGELSTSLLNDDGTPKKLENGRLAALARIAAAIHAEKEHLDAGACEQVVTWAKKIKLSLSEGNKLSDDYNAKDFEKKVEKIRSNETQQKLMQQAGKNLWAADGLIVLSTLIWLTFVGSFFIDTSFWYRIIIFCAAIYFYVKAGSLQKKSIGQSKDQEHRFWTSALREANTIDELQLAGLFSYFESADGRDLIDDPLGAATWHERERLSDALYRESYYSFRGCVPTRY